MIEIIPYSPEFKDAFYDVNHEWISSMFVMEEVDEMVLRNPEKYILADGGKIWFAKDEDLGVVGACALRRTVGNTFELTKMAVFEKARGLKVGETLLKEVLSYVKEAKIECFLLTNSACEAAIHLYEKNGFAHDEAIVARFGCEYQRCDVGMIYKA